MRNDAPADVRPTDSAPGKPLPGGPAAERLNPGQVTEGAGSAGARPPRGKSLPTAANPEGNGQLADGIRQRQCIVSGIDADEEEIAEKLADGKQ
jgi:hypothetical protein